MSPDHIGEEASNRRLRRVDWRFLLPDPNPAKVVAFADGSLRQALQTAFRSVSEPSPATMGAGDLAVAVDPDDATLRRVAASLRDGGTCWVEWHSLAPGGLRRARARLEAAGFRDVRCFWPWPALDRCRAWLPLEHEGALRYFAGWRRPTDGAVDRVVGAARRAQARLAVRLGLTRPVCAVARKPAASAPESDASGGEAWLLRQARVAGGSTLSATAREPLSCLLITGGPRSTSKIVALVLEEPAGRPMLAVKLARVSGSVPGMAREASVLRALAAMRPTPLPGVPRIAFDRALGDLLAIGESLMEGQPLQNLLRRHNARAWALKATEWQIRLAQHSQASTPASPWDRAVAPALTQFERSFGAVLDPGDLRNTRERLRGLGPLPVVCEQRDFSPWNVFVTPADELAVLDWESAEPAGLPAVDAIYFLTYVAFQVTGATRSGRFQASYRAGLDPTTPTGRWQRECLMRYVAATGLDPEELHPLRLFTWLLHARSEYERLVADHGSAPPAAALRGSLFVRLWQEEVRWGRT